MPDVLRQALMRVQRRWRARAIALSIAAGGALFALCWIVAMTIAGAPRVPALWSAALVSAVATAWLARRGGTLSPTAAARAIELERGSLDNLVVTAAELIERPRPVATEIQEEITRQAAERLRSVDAARVVPLVQPLSISVLVIAGCLLLLRLDSSSIASMVAGSASERPAGASTSALSVHITPPAYTKRRAEVLENPLQINVIAGSRVRIVATGSKTALRDWVATESAALELRTSAGAPAHFLSVVVTPDQPPALRVLAPGRDTAFAEPRGQIAITIDTRDDFGLASMSLHFTKASGGGENVSFTEGEVPLRLERRTEQQWTGHAELSLDALGLLDGDVVVYRAMARDTNPAGMPEASEQYLIEIGKNAQIADAGFSLPTEEKKYAISQQMVIYKTEKLLAGVRQGSAGGDSLLEESKLLAMEQRMVRAEVVFLGGGEVQDEVEEAAHSHELAEGRLENTGRAEMLRAINAMSRAEAQLNDGRVKEALVFEREALAALERALDRRRYFLRTLPDRSRIDVARRLTGERREARPWLRDAANTTGPAAVSRIRAVMRELEVAAAAASIRDGATLAARIGAVDPTSSVLQHAAVALASAGTDAGRHEAVRAAMTALTAHALATLPGTTAVDLSRDPLAGALGDAMATPSRRRP